MTPSAAQLEWQRAFAAHADVELMTFNWGEQTRTPWAIVRDDRLRWSWTAPEHFPDQGWALSVTIRTDLWAHIHDHHQVFIVPIHTRRVATTTTCVLVDRRSAADVIAEIIDRGRRYGARMFSQLSASAP